MLRQKSEECENLKRKLEPAGTSDLHTFVRPVVQLYQLLNDQDSEQEGHMLNLILETVQKVPLSDDGNLSEQKSFDRRLLLIKEYLQELSPSQMKSITNPYTLENTKKFLRALNHNVGETL